MKSGKLVTEIIMVNYNISFSGMLPDTQVAVRLVPSDLFSDSLDAKTKIQRKNARPVFVEKFEV